MKYLRLLAVLGTIYACSNENLYAEKNKDLKKLQKANDARKNEIKELRQQLEDFRNELMSTKCKLDVVNNYSSQVMQVLNQIGDLHERIDFMEFLLEIESQEREHKKSYKEEIEIKPKIPCFGKAG